MNNIKIQVSASLSCDYYRIALPYRRITLKSKSPVFIFNRVGSTPKDVVKVMKKTGHKIVCDIDDHWILNPEHYLYKHYTGSKRADEIIRNIKMADVVTVTTPLLAAKVKELNRNVVVIPNALPFDQGQFTLSKDKTSDTDFIYVGGPSHYSDLELIEGLDNDLTIAGFNPEEIEWQRVISLLKNAKFKNHLPTSEYMKAYEGHRVALAPLVDNAFNNCKSNIKILEAGAKGIPIIVSKCFPYDNPVDKPFVLYASNKYEWWAHMCNLQANPSLAEDMGAALAEHVRLQYHINDANELRRQVIESLG